MLRRDRVFKVDANDIRAGLDGLRKKVETGAWEGDHVAYKTLMDWKEGWILGHADDESVAKFPEEERVAWRKFWSGVEMALAEAEK